MKRKRETGILLCADAWLKIFLTLDTRDDITSLACASKFLYEISRTKEVSTHLAKCKRVVCDEVLGKIEFVKQKISLHKDCYEIKFESHVDRSFIELVPVPSRREATMFQQDRPCTRLTYRTKNVFITLTPYTLVTNNFRQFKIFYAKGALYFEDSRQNILL